MKAFSKVEGQALELLVRVPLAAIRDIQVPTRGDAGYLDLPAVKSMLSGAARYWIAGGFEVFDSGVPLPAPEVAATRLSISADRSFDTYSGALARLGAPDLPDSENVFWDQVWLDIRFRYPLPAAGRPIAIEPRLAALGNRVSTVLTHEAGDGTVRVFSFEGNPGRIYLNPRWTDAAAQFLARGAMAVLRNTDVLLLLFCLAMPFRRYRHFLPAVLAFIIAAGVSLVTAVPGLAPSAPWFRPLIDTLTAVSILLAAFANIAGRVTPRRRALLALASGLVVGLSFALRLAAALQFGGSHAAVSAAAFYAGLTAAILAATVLLVPALSWLFSRAGREDLERIIVSALAADTAWGWLTERWTQLRKVPLPTTVDAGLLAPALMALAVLVVLGGLVWFANQWLKSRSFADQEIVSRPGRETAR